MIHKRIKKKVFLRATVMMSVVQHFWQLLAPTRLLTHFKLYLKDSSKLAELRYRIDNKKKRNR